MGCCGMDINMVCSSILMPRMVYYFGKGIMGSLEGKIKFFFRGYKVA